MSSILLVVNYFDFGIRMFLIPKELISDDEASKIIAAHDGIVNAVCPNEEAAIDLIKRLDEDEFLLGCEISSQKDGEHGWYYTIESPNLLSDVTISHVVSTGIIP